MTSTPPAKFALVTGASAGTGGEIACALAETGYDVGIVGRNDSGLQACARRIEGAGRNALILHADLRNAEATNKALDRFFDWSGERIDVAINAAGVTGPLSPDIGSYSIEAFDEAVAVNLRAPFLILNRVLPAMRAQKSGAIINIGGNHGMRGRAGRSSYAASKWGLRGLSRSAALEAGPDNVTVNYIAPGAISVDRMKNAWRNQAETAGISEEKQLERYVKQLGVPLGRPNAPEDIVSTVLFMVSPAARSITGQEIIIDGGAIT
jgi:NAD(P)-dependent dehydrogenase (short-subunit alcohol dehydrogenase family)